MITESFDTRTEPVISPAMIYGAQHKQIDVCIVTFSGVILENVLNTYPCTEIGHMQACGGPIPIYAFTHEGRRVGVYLSPIGAALAGACVIEVNWLTGAESFIMFGSAGCLDRKATNGRVVVPTEAYRDEGMSYHYAPAADYIRITGAERVAELLRARHIPFVEGRVWTTDAIYRETAGAVEARKREGCLAVEMELAGVQAVADYHGFQLYDFLMTGDVLDAETWEVGDLAMANHSLDNFGLALYLASHV